MSGLTELSVLLQSLSPTMAEDEFVFVTYDAKLARAAKGTGIFTSVLD